MLAASLTTPESLALDAGSGAVQRGLVGRQIRANGAAYRGSRLAQSLDEVKHTGCARQAAQ